MPLPLDAAAVRRWSALGRESLRAHCARMDAINVFPVADGDTGTNLCLTFEAAVAALPAPEPTAGETTAGEPTAAQATAAQATAAEALRAMARAALLDARGNSGTILAEYLRGMAHGLAAEGGEPSGALPRALRYGARAAYAAVAHPVEGTMLTVAAAAADAAEAGGDPAVAAYEALAATPGRLAALARAGVVDAGGLGLTALLTSLWAALGERVPQQPASATAPGAAAGTGPAACAGPDHEPAVSVADGSPQAPFRPEFEVMYLLESGDPEAVDALRDRLDPLGDSLVVGGGEGLWSVHVHVGDAGAAVEAGLAAGRPYRIRITHLPTAESGSAAARDGAAGAVRGGAPCAVAEETPEPGTPARAVLSVVPGDGLAALCRRAGAAVLPAADAVRQDALVAAVRATGAAEVALLPNETELHPVAARAADAARAAGVRCAVIPTRAAVQGLAALAVHQPDRRFDEDVVTMTSAAGATRYGEVTVAERQSWTTAGVCQAGDVLGLVEGDVALIGGDTVRVATEVLARMLAAGGELVTLVVGARAPEGLATALEHYVRTNHLAVDTVVYEGQQQETQLLIGVE
ncbi:DAK2 domain-containing protein [Streptomyces spirodelae]|uniref:DAK2 domain-containing protein n=1 Tax=Streptomyces spirodelae TaxID=2812904 RepID=A0ABS3X0U3_9ACTN|nr:DAK2 domain-containing protein [Streptomyces spirodelae]MBO8189004.1 DAK2 domain-containing protein [Streptomyces spirodelae]